MKQQIILVIVTVVVLIAIMSLLAGFPVMWLWNWLMPVLFGLPKITFWQALGLNVLCSVLFKSYSINQSK